MKRNVVRNIINTIKGLFKKQKLLEEKTVVAEHFEKTEQEKISLRELEEMQYELENEYITEEELSENQKEQLKELYINQIEELRKDINYINYESKKKY